MARVLIYVALIFVWAFSSCTEAHSGNNQQNAKKKLTSEELDHIAALTEKVEFKFFITGEIPDACMELETEIRDLMQEIHDHNSNITFSFIDPYAIKDEIAREEFMEDLYVNKRIPFTAVMQDVNGIQSMKYIFIGGLISYKDAEFKFSLMSVSDRPDEDELKAACTNGVGNAKRNILFQIRKLLFGRAPRMAILTGHGEADTDRTFIMEKAMTDSYSIERVNLKNADGNVQVNALEGFDGLMVCNPRELFEEKEKFVIDQFIMRGGKVIWMIDPVYVNEDSLVMTGQTFGLHNEVGLSDMLFTYGVRLNEELALSQNAAPIGIEAAGGRVATWYFFPLLQPSPDYALLKGVSNIKAEYTGTLDNVVQNENVKFTELLETDQTSIYYKCPVRINYAMIQNQKSFQAKENVGKTVACLIEGEFKSHFKGLLPTGFEENEELLFAVESKATKMLVFADGDLVLNDTESVFNPKTGKKETAYLKLEKDKYHVMNGDGTDKYRYGNLEFFMILIDEIMFDLEK